MRSMESLKDSRQSAIIACSNCNAYEETGSIITNAETAGDPLSRSSYDIPTATPRQKLVLDAQTVREHRYTKDMIEIDQNLSDAFTEIAQSNVPSVITLEEQHSDDLDFHIIHISSLRDMLHAAFMMGATDPGSRKMLSEGTPL